ncbi:hypothetical protein NL676_023123 [Syzygium grande]|nr:hypothetical protein NL676_023123 [Syzygium grande]
MTVKVNGGCFASLGVTWDSSPPTEREDARRLRLKDRSETGSFTPARRDIDGGDMGSDFSPEMDCPYGLG